jgi:hypothetical protein
MSGGHFDYNQYQIGYIADEIEHAIEKSGRPKTKEELKEEYWRGEDWYEKYPEDLNYHKYSDEVIEKFKEAVKALRAAQIYAHRVDWLLSSDDGEECFLRRLNEELTELNEKYDNA